VKITKTQLTKLIKEEFAGLQKEGYGEDVDRKALENAIYALEDVVMPPTLGTPLEQMVNELLKKLYEMTGGRR